MVGACLLFELRGERAKMARSAVPTAMAAGSLTTYAPYRTGTTWRGSVTPPYTTTTWMVGAGSANAQTR